MRGVDVKRRMMYLAMLIFLFSCGQHLPLGVEEELYRGEEKGGVLAITIDNVSPQTARTIAPAHIDAQQLQTNYDLKLSGTTGYQGFPEEVITIDNTGRATLRKIPAGEWELTLTAYNKTGNAATLRGRTTVTVTDLEITPVSFTLTPLFTGNGTGNVSVQFTIPQGIASRLDTTNGNKQVTVALYYDEIDAEVQGTRQVFNLSTTSATTFTYTQSDVPEGQYSIRLSASYTVNNASTLYQNLTHVFGYRDIVYVENNRDSTGSVTFSDTVLGVPNKPYRKDKVTRNVTVKTSNSTTGYSSSTITGSQSFPVYGEGLWMHAANWDGNGGNDDRLNGTWGNEIIFLEWDVVYNADYYELEVLLHPKYAHVANSAISNGAKYPSIPVTDAQWTTFENYNPKPHKLVFSGGGSSDPNYYKTKTYTINIYERNVNSANRSFMFLAWRDLAVNINPVTASDGTSVSYSYQDGNYGSPYVPAPGASGVTRFKNSDYRIGLEGDCNALAILGNSYSPQNWYGIRIRAVNEHGYSDWVYWKGGIN